MRRKPDFWDLYVQPFLAMFVAFMILVLILGMVWGAN